MRYESMQYDNIEDRKEIFKILENHLDERLRQEFLSWCCRNVDTKLKDVLRPGKESTWHPKEVYWQLMSLVMMHHLDIDKAAKKLVEIARTGKVIYEN